MFWLCHILTVFWGLSFPFAARRFRNLNRMKYIHVICVILGLLLPIVPVAATIIQFSRGKLSSEAIQRGLGFGVIRLPPILCAGIEKNTTFYSLIFPASLILMVGIAFLVYIFWIIHKVRSATGIIITLVRCLSDALYLHTYMYSNTAFVETKVLVVSTILTRQQQKGRFLLCSHIIPSLL